MSNFGYFTDATASLCAKFFYGKQLSAEDLLPIVEAWQSLRDELIKEFEHLRHCVENFTMSLQNKLEPHLSETAFAALRKLMDFLNSLGAAILFVRDQLITKPC